MALQHLIDEASSRLTNPTAAIFAYWPEELGDVQLDEITTEHVALHATGCLVHFAAGMATGPQSRARQRPCAIT